MADTKDSASASAALRSPLLQIDANIQDLDRDGAPCLDRLFRLRQLHLHSLLAKCIPCSKVKALTHLKQAEQGSKNLIELQGRDMPP